MSQKDKILQELSSQKEGEAETEESKCEEKGEGESLHTISETSSETPGTQESAESGSTAESVSDQKFENIMEKLGGFEKKSKELQREKEHLVKELKEKKEEIEEIKGQEAKTKLTLEGMK